MSKRDATWISDRNPEDEKFWESKGKFIARRNLIWSIVAEHLGFSIWLSALEHRGDQATTGRL
jgi:MFS transporter, NNP family, nitrate/nitrite transporter